MASSVPGARRATPTLGWGAGACLVAAGWMIGLRSLVDNSFFTHLATGRIILDQGSVPSADPYTFSAHGEPWVVQSWLASLLYGTVEALGGAVGLRLLMGVVAAVLTALAWRLTRPATSLVVRLALGVVFVAGNAELWAERPFMLGLVALAVVALSGEGLVDPRWLVPLAWIWVNVHGSFPLGLAYLAVLAVGARLDGAQPAVELRALRWLALGVVLGAVGPLGPRVLTFPVELLRRQELLANVIEWRAPTFDSFSQRLFLVQVALAILLLVRTPSYRRGLVLAVFVVAALLGMRNLTVASLLLLPGMAEAAPSLGSLRADLRGPIATALAGLGITGIVLLGAARLSQRDYELREYPSDALAFLEVGGVDLEEVHLATPDIVGNYLELLYGPGRVAFYDDRFDMFPDAVSDAHLSLVRADAGMRASLDRFDVDLVVWEQGGATASRLTVDPAWRVLYTDERWEVICRRGAELGGRLRTC